MKYTYRIDHSPYTPVVEVPLPSTDQEYPTREHNDDPVRRCIARIELVDNQWDADAGAKVTLLHQRRGSSKAWEDYPKFKQTAMRAGEEVHFFLDATQARRLYFALRGLYHRRRAQGTPALNDVLEIDDENEDLIVAGREREILERLIESGGERVFEYLDEITPDLDAHFYQARLNKKRRQVVDRFRLQVERKDWREHDWQKFFKENDWIFGHGLAYQFLETVTEQAYVGGQSFDGKGAQRVDYLLAARADARFTVLVDIKTPQSRLVGNEYRNGVYQLGADLVGGVSQVQSYCHSFDTEVARTPNARRDLERQQIYTCRPRGILVIGLTAELDDDSKRSTFELFRQELHNPEVATFDELLARAEFLVQEAKQD